MDVRRPLMFLTVAAALAGAAVAACSPGSLNDDASEGQELTDHDDLFDKTTALPITLSAPVSTLFSRYHAGRADPVAPEAGARNVLTFSEPGQLVFKGSDGQDKTLDVRVHVRGESSRFDCPFPKLKVEFLKKEQLKGTPFKGHGTIRLNTHCGPGDVNARSGMGRVLNGIGPVREDLVYRLIRALDVPTYLTRVAAITYDDQAAHSRFESFAMIMESGDDAAQRFSKGPTPLIEGDGGAYLEPTEARGSASPANTAQITVAEALAGNGDYSGLHNVDAFGVPGAPTLLKIPEDFDLCPITLASRAQWATPVARASEGLRTPGVAAQFWPKKGVAEAALAQATKDGIAAKALPSADGQTTEDPGFKEARARLDELFALPEFHDM